MVIQLLTDLQTNTKPLEIYLKKELVEPAERKYIFIVFLLSMSLFAIIYIYIYPLFILTEITQNVSQVKETGINQF